MPDVTRCWPSLKTIQLESEKGLPSIVDGVEREMFPDLTTVRCYEFDYYSIDKLSLFNLFKANIFVHKKIKLSSAFDTCKEILCNLLVENISFVLTKVLIKFLHVIVDHNSNI